ncbi:histone deacetylase 15 isoform X1 [Ananas comosus]|uniref:histone deacetylase n=1 Tax=Ananas comosus TaxID=4615 RepID=A0A6P5ETX4_ANACO|nr:histone deacetylase 15 isoform X1 [Ananas comosus]XP_020087206.1 histone deacetylase 15 isoform X1 [Ananas comosus]XP_020087207.1 histone deacetylase 15 isoform X1 [Ananas comosus]XP_020087208.1 histone deacetylase 15 isoform X1 [Ananas comosus]XP_020087209.1 histone deacetylase 15 isoform X1 [Ananas comosus]XP_020087211.1 histone deacetylase 15 isoform X1 [Ananas comosus]
MASETLHISRQKGSDFCQENKIHDPIEQVDCQNSCSSFCQCSKRSASDGSTFCFRERCSGQKLVEDENDGPGKINPIDSNVLSEPTIRHVENADENACSHCENESCKACGAMQPQDYRRTHKGNSANSLQDLFLQDNYDDGEDDDSDWEPVSHLLIKKWFCYNCTMPNFDDVFHCDVCGEHRESQVRGYDTFLKHIGEKVQVSVDSDTICSFPDTASSSKSCTAFGFDERMLLHSEVEVKPHPHPERPDRLRAIASSLVAAGIFPGKCSLIAAREISQEELMMVHTLDHIEAVEETKNMLSSYFTLDTYANEHSACAARLAAGLCADLACLIICGHSKNGFALVRPPGHHAGVKQAMGFCLHNNAAVAALAARRAGAKKVLIVDWDVHHGNGTQEIFDGNNSVLYISLHRHEGGRFYPGTGAADEVGINGAEGYSVNIPWSRGGVGDNDYFFAFQHVVLPIASEFAPDIIIISAGFDAARGDPLGCCDVTPAGYAQMADMLANISEGKLLVILEGGYNLHSISSSATAVVKVLVGEKPSYDLSNVMPSKAGLRTVMEVLKIQLKYWPVLESHYTALQAQWGPLSWNNRHQPKKRRHLIGPIWWQWGSKRFVYELLYGRPHLRDLKRIRRQQ